LSAEYPVLTAAVPHEDVGREPDAGTTRPEPAASSRTAPETGPFSPDTPGRDEPEPAAEWPVHDPYSTAEVLLPPPSPAKDPAVPATAIATGPAWSAETAVETPFLPPTFASDAAPSARGRKSSPPARPGVSFWLVLPLISYSVLATGLLVTLWNRLQTKETHPLIAFLPDADGDAPGVIRKPKAVNEARKRKLNAEPIPDEFKIRLGQTRTVGALAITPQRVAWEQVGVGSGSAAPVRLNGPSLVLHLRLENVSADETFQPMDRYFDRKWRDGGSTPPPLTFLDAGPGRQFYGGPAEWRPRSSARNISAAPEFIYLMGTNQQIEDPIDRQLAAGESTEVFICTDGNDPRAAALASYRGNFSWRVHLRRGLVRVLDWDVPAQAVVEVLFSDREVGG
jgi:hypothetical protein